MIYTAYVVEFIYKGMRVDADPHYPHHLLRNGSASYVFNPGYLDQPSLILFFRLENTNT